MGMITRLPDATGQQFSDYNGHGTAQIRESMHLAHLHCEKMIINLN